MVASRVYFSVEVAQFLLDLTKNSDWWQWHTMVCSSSGLWWQWRPVDGTPSPHLGLDTLRPELRHRERERERQLHSQHGAQGEQAREGAVRRGYRIPAEEHEPV